MVVISSLNIATFPVQHSSLYSRTAHHIFCIRLQAFGVISSSSITIGIWRARKHRIPTGSLLWSFSIHGEGWLAFVLCFYLRIDMLDLGIGRIACCLGGSFFMRGLGAWDYSIMDEWDEVVHIMVCERDFSE
ncbi:hypothetical protein EYC80_006271 [Monilinia laxa]|uniref:Uncharacterized protein n=1 Tax=Monilinia laxa TaxID=61186 RepID=A0A5N6KGQ8_MONLA|nr:hypothetical protein EYC80_006271 [Monilinia laxa]